MSDRPPHRIRSRLPLRTDQWLLVALFMVASAALIFLKLASEVQEGETMAFDTRFLVWLRATTAGTTPLKIWLRDFMLDLTALGARSTLVLIAAIVTGYLLVIGRRATALFLAAALLLGGTASALLKLVFERARPGVVPHLVVTHSASFPSAHAMDSALVYLTLAALLARTTHRVGVRLYILSVAIALTLAIGFSRLYLGVHWPTDVIAGWIVGSAWAAGSSALALRLQRRRTVEQPD